MNINLGEWDFTQSNIITRYSMFSEGKNKSYCSTPKGVIKTTIPPRMRVNPPN